MYQRQYSYQDIIEQQIESPIHLKRVHSVTDNFDDQSIYQLILTHQVIKNIQILSICKEKDPFSLHKKHIVNYVIKITTDYFDYQIQRRYKQFLSLYEQLKRKISFSEFPEKKLFQSNKSEVIQQRKNQLEQFLQTILNQLENLKSIEFLKFIEIKEQFIRRGFDNIKLHGLSIDQLDLIDVDELTQKPQNDIEKSVISYIQKLNNRKLDRGKTIHQLESFLFGKMQFISSNILLYLFIGDRDLNIDGLIYMIETETHLQCNTILNFIKKLLEFDYNPFAEISLKVFSELNMKQIKQMKLQDHILQQRKCQQNALFLLYKYLEGNHLLDEKIIKYLIEDDQAYQQYLNYKLSKTFNESQKTLDSSDESITPATTQETIRKFSSKEMIFLEDDNTPEFLIKLLNLNYEWKLVKQYRNCSLLHLQGQIVKNQYILYTNSISNVYKLFTEQKQWKSSFKKFEIIEQIDNNNFIAIEKFLWSIKSVFQQFVYVSKFHFRERNDNKLIFTVEYIKDGESYLKKNEILSKKVSYVEIQKLDDKRIEVITMTNLIDQEQKNHLLPLLLNEDNSFEKQIDQLYQYI